MNSKNAISIFIAAILVGCVSKEAHQQDASAQIFLEPELTGFLTLEQFLETIKSAEQGCDHKEAVACWYLFSQYRQKYFKNEKIHSIEKSDKAFEKLCKIESVSCKKNNKVVSESKTKSTSVRSSGNSKHLVNNKYITFSYVEY